jgi:putative transposase
MDEHYLLAAAKYVELNPVRAKLAARPEDYPWSSANAHLQGEDDRLVKCGPLLELVADWTEFLNDDQAENRMRPLRRHENTGRALGSEDFIHKLETILNRIISPLPPGPKPSN